MKRPLLYMGVALLAALAPGLGGPPQRDGLRLPNGKLQKEETLKADHQDNVRDAAELAELAQALHGELEENEGHVLSVNAIRKTEQIEKLAKKIRSRMRRSL
jgi:hypothetical protein